MTDLMCLLAASSTVAKVSMVGTAVLVVVAAVFALCVFVRWLLKPPPRAPGDNPVEHPPWFKPSVHDESDSLMSAFQQAEHEANMAEVREQREAMLDGSYDSDKPNEAGMEHHVTKPASAEEDGSDNRLEYKVWACVEQYDPETDDYQEMDSQDGSVRTFKDEEEAQALVHRLTMFGQLPEMQQVALLTRQLPDVGRLKEMVRDMQIKNLSLTTESWSSESARRLKALLHELEHPSSAAAVLDVSSFALGLWMLVIDEPVSPGLEAKFHRYVRKAFNYPLDPA